MYIFLIAVSSASTFQYNPDSMLILALERGRLKLHLVVGARNYETGVGERLDDGEWYTVQVLLGAGQYILEGK